MTGSAFEARGLGIWTNNYSSVPMTMPFEKFEFPLRSGKSGAMTKPTHQISRSVGDVKYTTVPVPAGSTSEPVPFGTVSRPVSPLEPLPTNVLEPLLLRDEAPSLYPRSSVHRRGESV